MLHFHFSAEISSSTAMVLSTETARTIVGVVGNVIALILFLSPVPTFVNIWKKKSVEQYSPIPYLCTFVNCCLWVVYGLPVVHPHSILVITINGAGVVIEFVYLMLFVVYSDAGKKRRKVLLVMLAEVLFVGALALPVLTLAHTTKLRSAIVGSICMVGNVMMYASPLSIMRLVLKTKSVEYMPFFLSLFSFANGVSWTIYALIRFDPFIAVPNGIGALLGVAQLILYATFYKSTKRQLEEKKAKGEVSLAVKPISSELP